MLVRHGPAMRPLLHDAKVLIVDDEPANLILLQKILKAAGYTCIRTSTEPRNVISLVGQCEPDIILLDLQMPHLDGFAVMDQLKEQVPASTLLPVLVLTADATPKTKLRALSSGAHDFLTKPFDPAEVVQRVGNLLQTRRLQLQVQEQNKNLEQLVSERTMALEEALRRLQETQQKAIQQERLHAFGTMASGVTHDFNNALSVILGFGEVALMECEGEMRRAELETYLRTIITAGLDAGRMVTRLREFYRPGAENEPRTVVDLNEIIKQAVATTRPKWHSESLGSEVSILVEVELADIPPISADASELREALMNLIFNAVDAMHQGGAIKFATKYVDQRVVLHVSDTGVGMPEEVRLRCLEPFFTTKGEAGTGLGLAMVYGIVERHGGTLDIQSMPGMGTTFIISLPPALDAANEITAQRQKSVSPLKVLVADDQPELCAVMAKYLVNDCHAVETASDGRTALEAFRASNFDLVIADQAMPGMSGKQLATAIKKDSPGTPIILLTGFSETGNSAPLNKVIDRVLTKPVSPIDLRHAIVEVMVHITQPEYKSVAFESHA
jgi:signal transduction histidine kinase